MYVGNVRRMAGLKVDNKLSQVKLDSTIAKNVIKAFGELHSRKVCHGDVRVENILVRPNGSVVVIDFETSIMNADEISDIIERRDERSCVEDRAGRIINQRDTAAAPRIYTVTVC